MGSYFVADAAWKEYELNISDEYGFKQFTISESIKEIVNCLNEAGCKKILDLGCGSGRHSIYLNKNGFDVYASDLNCKDIRVHTDALNIKNIKIFDHSFTDIPYEDDFFDAVLCTSTLHHAVVDDIIKGIYEVHRVLKSGGYFIFDILSIEDDTFGIGELIEKNTFIGGRAGEEGIPHHYTSCSELKILLSMFYKIESSKGIYKFSDALGMEHKSKVYDIVAIK